LANEKMTESNTHCSRLIQRGLSSDVLNNSLSIHKQEAFAENIHDERYEAIESHLKKFQKKSKKELALSSHRFDWIREHKKLSTECDHIGKIIFSALRSAEECALQESEVHKSAMNREGTKVSEYQSSNDKGIACLDDRVDNENCKGKIEQNGNGNVLNNDDIPCLDALATIHSLLQMMNYSQTEEISPINELLL